MPGKLNNIQRRAVHRLEVFCFGLQSGGGIGPGVSVRGFNVKAEGFYLQSGGGIGAGVSVRGFKGEGFFWVLLPMLWSYCDY